MPFPSSCFAYFARQTFLSISALRDARYQAAMGRVSQAAGNLSVGGYKEIVLEFENSRPFS